MLAMIIPGNNNSEMSECWYPYVKKELERLGIEVIAKNMPDPDIARKEYWLPFIENQLNGEQNTILIGHSSGAVAILRFLETHKALGTVLVGACYTDLGDAKEKASGYFNDPWQWEKIKHNVKWIIQFASTDDPYIPIEDARHIAKQVDSEYHEYTDQGHFSDNHWGKKEFPELIKAIKKRIDSKN